MTACVSFVFVRVCMLGLCVCVCVCVCKNNNRVIKKKRNSTSRHLSGGKQSEVRGYWTAESEQMTDSARSSSASVSVSSSIGIFHSVCVGGGVGVSVYFCVFGCECLCVCAQGSRFTLGKSFLESLSGPNLWKEAETIQAPQCFVFSLFFPPTFDWSLAHSWAAVWEHFLLGGGVERLESKFVCFGRKAGKPEDWARQEEMWELASVDPCTRYPGQ